MNSSFMKTFLNVRVADTPEERKTGLQGREKLSNYEALLLDFDQPSNHKIWMKDTHVPLDIVFMDEDANVIDIKQGEPQDTTRLSADENVSYVLELKRGKAEDFGIEPGNSMEEIVL
jgi:Uncharacterized conserved protein